MYAGTTIRLSSGNVMGAHQRLDRIARRHLDKLIRDEANFPPIKRILHFEGNNGPDGVKRKSPSVDEPWHFIDPQKANDTSLIDMIVDHLHNLTEALKSNDMERAAFEASWSAHAIVDGLTPAHHYPLADKIEELFGVPHTERVSVKQKNFIRGSNRRDTISKNWQYWGGKGVFSTHVMFELGVATTMVGRRYRSTVTDQDLIDLKLRGYEAIFRESLERVVAMDVYRLFQRTGWSWSVANIVHSQLIPEILRAVVLAWYSSIKDSEI